MGMFSVPVEIGDAAGMRWERIEALVDTGAAYSLVPGEILERLGVHREVTRRLRTADGRVVPRSLGLVMTRLEGEEWPVLTIFGEPGDSPFIGAHTLEAFALGVDPVDRRLVRHDSMLL